MAEQGRLVSDLGPHDAMILRDHGLLVCGPSVTPESRSRRRS
jgi:ribulose-5-phosphate 4-epimerase/fuculose-1-phosphate aldolase